MSATETDHVPGAVLWDLDGTLVDSAEHHWHAWRTIMRAEGVSITHDQFLRTFGKKNDLILRDWFGADLPGDRSRRIGDAKEAHYRRLVERHGVVPLPGASEWVRWLHKDGWRQAIASSAPRLNVDAVMRVLGFGEVFGAVVAAEDVTAGKPDPQVFLMAATRLAVAPPRSIVVEDAAAGIEAARRAGMRCIGVNPAGDLPADVAVTSLTDLPRDVFRDLLRRPHQPTTSG